MKEMTIVSLNEMLVKGTLTSVELVQYCLDRIAKIDPLLNSVAELNPDALSIAHQLDEERKIKGPRSLMHGIPLLIKDNINTHDQMHTTANSLALSDLKAPYDASIVTQLRKAGAIILGKANLSEFAYFMGDEKMPSGYGSLHGQVKHPYNQEIDPLGSSTGSAVSVAADLVPVSIGTETNGSLMAPAYMNGIVSMKPTLGMVSRYGIIPISAKQDTAGPMGKTVKDCAILLDILAKEDPKDPITKDAHFGRKHLSESCERPVKGMKVGLLFITQYPYSDEEKGIIEEVRKVFLSQGVQVIDITFEAKRVENHKALVYDFKHDLNAYLESVKGYTKMNNLSDIIEFNKIDPERRMKYGQSLLIESNEKSGDLEDPVYVEMRKLQERETRRFEDIMYEHGLTALVSTIWTSYAPVYGNPCITVPGKAITDKKPIGVVFVGQKFDDGNLLAIAHTYEQKTKHRIPPVFN
jgi:amidase